MRTIRRPWDEVPAYKPWYPMVPTDDYEVVGVPEDEAHTPTPLRQSIERGERIVPKIQEFSRGFGGVPAHPREPRPFLHARSIIFAS